MKLTVLIVSILASAGCISSTTDDQHCSDPAGLYHVSYVKQSGDCGDISDRDIVIPNYDTTNCSVVASHVSNNNCSTSMELRCTDTISSGTSTTYCSENDIITLDSNKDNSHVYGTLSANVQCQNGTYCSGTYNLTYIRTHQ